jgi:hypothetical protein
MPPIAISNWRTAAARPSAIRGHNKEAIVMRKIYVSDSGNDQDDGLSEKTPIRSWQRFIQLCEGNDEIIIMGSVDTGKMRLIAEIDKKGRIAQGEVAPKSVTMTPYEGRSQRSRSRGEKEVGPHAIARIPCCGQDQMQSARGCRNECTS